MKIKKIYFDMDGVLADFDLGVEELTGFIMSTPDQDLKTKEEIDALWAAVRKVPNFYDKLEPLKNGLELFEQIKEAYPGTVEILTGVPRPDRGLDTAADDKIAWAKRILGEDIPVHTVCRKDKKNYCKGKEYVLVDDRRKNIEEWEEAGGSAILYKEGETDMKIFLNRIS